MISSAIANIEVITPPIETLIDMVNHDDLVCTVKGCEKKMNNASSLRLHIVKSHGIGTLGKKESNGKTLMYACPILGCPRSADSQRQHFFRILYRLKLHYTSQHAEKKFTCGKCLKKFGSFEIKEKHMGRCHQLFQCSCGTFYTTRNAVLTHAKRKGPDHILIENEGSPQQNKHETKLKNEKISLQNLQTYTIPGVLYILPSQTLNGKLKSSGNGFSSKQVDILPKVDPMILNENSTYVSDKSMIIESNYSYQTAQPVNALPIDGDFISDGNSTKCDNEINNVKNSSFDFKIEVSNVKNAVFNLNNRLLNSKSSNKEFQKLSKYEKRMLYLASKEAKEVLSDPLLLKMTLLKQQQQQETKKKKLKTASSVSKKKIFIEQAVQTKASSQLIDCYGELGSSADSLAKTFCITPNSFKDIDPGIQKNNLTCKNSESLQTCDFGMQCKLPVDSENIFSLDEETQTDSLMTWLSEFNDGCNMETQTVLKDSNLPLGKSIQLDFLISESSLSDQIGDCNNIGTQTTHNMNNSWLSENFSEVFAIGQNTSSTQTDPDCLYLNIDFSRTKRDLLPNSYNQNQDDNIISTNTFGTQTFSSIHQQIYSSGTQTFDLIDLMLDETTKNNETQTPLSFCDLVDSFITEEYLNVPSFVSKPKSFIG
ncbi:uncharacterized protein LOC101237680 isoform X2 [Hydra vulgaris]|uniref:Uncharacterized protein LOC101237680 isoform X2 n=1 Tax=Hydra vulgaris TaxID=6087 RepID=A0ABM4BJ92_HYDVU